MDSYFAKLYLELADHLKEQVPALRWIDQDFGQLEEDDIRPATSFPCALIDIGDADYTDLSENVQHGTVRVLIRLGFAPFSSSHQGAPGSVKDKALQYYNLEQQIYEAVQGWYNEFSTPFTRRKFATEGRNDKLRVRVLMFETTYEDESAMVQYSKTPRPNLDIDPVTS